VTSAEVKKETRPARHENIYTIPNLLTFSRLVAAPCIGYCILHDQPGWALGLFAWAGVSDLLDGWIARRWHQGTVVGTVIDPMADKTLMTVLTVCLAANGALPSEFWRESRVDSSPATSRLELIVSISMAGSHHTRPRRWSRHRRHILPLDLATASKDLGPLLGLLLAFRRGPPHLHQQVQYLSTARPHGLNYGQPGHHDTP
jgi:hypothetical protein